MSQENVNSTIDIGSVSSQTIVHTNVDHEVIITTDDKIKLILIKSKEILSAQTEWWTPAGLLISFVTTFSTAEFKDVYGITADTWKAVFIILTVLSAIWLGKSLIKLYNCYGENDVEKILESIKKTSR